MRRPKTVNINIPAVNRPSSSMMWTDGASTIHDGRGSIRTHVAAIRRRTDGSATGDPFGDATGKSQAFPAWR